MIVENKLTSYLFTDVPPVAPSTWDLDPFIPEGTGLLEYTQYRYRIPNQFWTPWYPITAFNDGIATAPVPNGAESVEFRRKTPRYSLVRDPQAPTSRVAQPDLQLTADQGMFVAIEWAAEYGVDAHLQLVSGEPPLSIGDMMFTQLHYGPDTDYTQKVWNFRFAGGYREPEDVRVQIKVAGVWQALTIDYSEYDHLNPSGAQYKLQDPFQLYLDFGELAAQIEGMVIYRRTPREFPIPTPSHRSQITAEGMTPTATQAYFVALEVGEEVTKNVPHCECLTVFTSEPYKAVGLVEKLRPVADLNAGALALAPRWTDPMTVGASIMSGELRLILQAYTTGNPELLRPEVAILSGILKVVLLQYVSPPEKFQVGVGIQSGTLVVILVPYNNAVPEKIQVGVAIQGGTLV